MLEAPLAIIGGLAVLAWLGCFVSAAVLSRAEDGRDRADAAMDQAIANTKTPAPRIPPRAAPGPPFTPAELDRYAQIDQWAQRVDADRLEAAEIMADLFRAACPELADDDLGRVILQAARIGREYGLDGSLGRLPGTFSLAAASLTRLSRTDVHLDQH